MTEKCADQDRTSPFGNSPAQTVASSLAVPSPLLIPTMTIGANRTQVVARSPDLASVDRFFAATHEEN
jgi:hypothetical protein